MAGRHSPRHPERLSLNCFVLRQGKTSIASRMSYSAYLEAARTQGSGSYSSDKLCNELSAVAARCSIHCNAPQAALSMPCCYGDQKLLCVHRVLQWQARELQVHASIQAARYSKPYCPAAASTCFQWRSETALRAQSAAVASQGTPDSRQHTGGPILHALCPAAASTRFQW